MEVKWIKITTNIFDDEKIKIIDTMPDRDTLLVIWFKLLAMAGKVNDNGLVYIVEKMPTNAEMLATIFNRPIPTVRLALQTFENFGMIEINDHVSIVNWEKHQNIDKLNDMREKNALRQKRHREKKRIEQGDNVTVTLRNDIDKNRIDKNRIDKNKKNIPTESEFLEYAKVIAQDLGKRFDKGKALNKYKACIENDWRDGNDNIIKNWKGKFRNLLKYEFTDSIDSEKNVEYQYKINGNMHTHNDREKWQRHKSMYEGSGGYEEIKILA